MAKQTNNQSGSYISSFPEIHKKHCNRARYDHEKARESLGDFLFTKGNKYITENIGKMYAEVTGDEYFKAYDCDYKYYKCDDNDSLLDLATEYLQDRYDIWAEQQGYIDSCVHDGKRIEVPEGVSETGKERIKLALSKLRKTDKLERKEVDWLIPGYIPKGAISVLCAEGGIGKGGIWTALAAAVSRNEVPDFLGIPFKGDLGLKNPLVMYASSEDSSEHVIVGRLEDNGANRGNIIEIPLDEEEFENLTFDSEILEGVIANIRPALVIFDPIQSFIDKTVRMGERNGMRQALTPLMNMGQKYGTAFLLIVHANKGKGNYGRRRVSDSSDIWDIARSVLMLGMTENQGIRYMSHEKCNYGDLSDTVLFTFENGRVINKGRTTKRDRDYQAEVLYEKAAPAKDEAVDFIEDYLKDGQPHPVKELEEAARAAGISKYAIRKAKEQLKEEQIIKFKSETEGQGNGVIWTVFLVNDTK